MQQSTTGKLITRKRKEKGRILDVQYPETGTTIYPGQSVTISIDVSSTEASCVNVIGYSFYQEDQFCSEFFSEIPQAVALY